MNDTPTPLPPDAPAPKYLTVDDLVFLGLNGTVAAIEKQTGQIVWSNAINRGFLGSGMFVTLLCDDQRVFAHTNGKIYCLEILTGRLLWSNGLEGYGYGFGSLCLPGMASVPDAATCAAIAAEEQAAHNASQGSHPPPAIT